MTLRISYTQHRWMMCIAASARVRANQWVPDTDRTFAACAHRAYSGANIQSTL